MPLAAQLVDAGLAPEISTVLTEAVQAPLNEIVLLVVVFAAGLEIVIVGALRLGGVGALGLEADPPPPPPHPNRHPDNKTKLGKYKRYSGKRIYFPLKQLIGCYTVKLYGPYKATPILDLSVSNENDYAKIIKHISANIKNQRKRCGFTQAHMIEFGFDIKNYQKLEYGKHQFSLHTVFRLSRAFNCPIEALVNEPKIRRKK